MEMFIASIQLSSFPCFPIHFALHRNKKNLRRKEKGKKKEKTFSAATPVLAGYKLYQLLKWDTRVMWSLFIFSSFQGCLYSLEYPQNRIRKTWCPSIPTKESYESSQGLIEICKVKLHEPPLKKDVLVRVGSVVVWANERLMPWRDLDRNHYTVFQFNPQRVSICYFPFYNPFSTHFSTLVFVQFTLILKCHCFKWKAHLINSGSEGDGGDDDGLKE